MRESEILASTYHDRMDVYRTVMSESSEHLSETTDKKIGVNVLCELDKGSESLLEGDVQGVSTSYTVFTQPDVDVLEGDKLIISHLGRVYECVAGMPFKFSSHLDIPVTLKERI